MTETEEQAALLAAANHQTMAELAAATRPAETMPGAEWNPVVIPMVPDATGETLTIGRLIQFDPEGHVLCYALAKTIGPQPTKEAARAAIEAHILGLGRIPPEDHLIAADMLALISDVIAEAKARQMQIGPDREWLRGILDRADEIIAMSLGKGLRAQSFNDRERDLLAANNRLLERARTAEASAEHSLGFATRALDRVEELLEKTARRVRHKKRQSTYQVLGEGEAQISTTCVRDADGGVWPSARVLKEGDRLVVYRSEEDGKLWFRFPDEFEDGRFEDLA